MSLFLQDLLPPKVPTATFDVEDPVEIFHQQTKYHRLTLSGQAKRIRNYLYHPRYIALAAAGFKRYPSHPQLRLPDPLPLTMTLQDALAARQSARVLSGTMTLAMVSSLLHHALRINRRARSQLAQNVSIGMRPYPSPGGLYPNEFYLLLNHIDGVPSCIAHYDADAHRLHLIMEQNGNVFDAVRTQAEDGKKDGISDAPLVVVLTSLPQRATSKYGARGYRMALLEAGHASQNLCLCAAGLGLGSLAYGGYYDDELARLLEVDGVTETVVGVLAFGQSVATMPAGSHI